ncbi:MAG: methyltransferase domain-containing protein [Nitrospira sp. NTP1]|nr:methyltransferase domain-containing protein [Nitrospira sp. NTP1]
MGLYATYMFPRLMDWVLRGARFQTERRLLLASAHGVVLEIGFGTGLNLPHYPSTVTDLHTVEPATLLPDRVTRRVASAPFPVHLRRLSAEVLPYTEGLFDCAVSTFTLCTIPDGCHLNRRMDELIVQAGFRLDQLDRYTLPGVPRIGGEMYRGIART